MQVARLFNKHAFRHSAKTLSTIIYPSKPPVVDTTLSINSTEELMQAIRESPWALYKQMVERITQNGACAPMPEFQPAVEALQEQIQDDSLTEIIQHYSVLEPFRTHALKELFHISLDFSVTTDPSYPPTNHLS